MVKPSRDKILNTFKYDPETGLLFWRDPSRARKAKAGRAGWAGKDGYLRVRLEGRSYQVSHIAWLIVHGEWPSSMIDHKNRDVADNRISNLRPATNAQNQANKVGRKSSTGLKGVSVLRDRPVIRYRAGIVVAGKYRVLGYFKTPEDAHAAYARAATTAFGEFARAQ